MARAISSPVFYYFRRNLLYNPPPTFLNSLCCNPTIMVMVIEANSLVRHWGKREKLLKLDQFYILKTLLKNAMIQINGRVKR